MSVAKAAVAEGEAKLEAALPTSTRLKQHDKHIRDLEWRREQTSQNATNGRKQFDWWQENVDAHVGALDGLDVQVAAAKEAKKKFMLAASVE